MLNRNISVNTAFTNASIINFTRGNKFFELSNHLGNVLVTISDKKIGHDAGNGTIDYYNADVVTANDYYSFGSLMPGRNYNALGAKDYRYGFNGKENDNEVKGEGNQQDYGFRIYDPRVGRFLSTDPLTKSYPWYTPYQFASNSPIVSIDMDGLEGFVATGMPLGNSGVSHGMIITTQDAAKINRNVAIAAFKAVFSEALPKKFIDHYANGNGKPYTLNRNEAVDIKSVPTGLKGIVAADKEKFDNLIAGAKKGSKITLPEGYSIQGGATTGGTLGRFTTNLTGTITIDKNNATKWSFEGTMQFNDTWDFKTNAVTDKDLQRSEWGDIQTKIGGKFLPGQGFKVTSEVMPVKQTSSDASFDWYKGKAADGKQNEISNDMQNHPTEAKEAIKTGKSG